jgi:hypothetical protein
MSMAASARDVSSAEARRAYEAEFDALFASIPFTPPRVLAQRFVRLDTRLDAGMAEVKSAMLVPSLLSTDEDAALGRWIHLQHAQLARIGCEIIVAALDDAQVDDAMGLRLVAISLLHLGESVKWELIEGRAARRDYAALHELARLALARGWLHSPCEVVVDRIERAAMIDALYFRALLLDRFTSGSLSRQQVEVLDAFLWEWTPWLMALEEPRGAVMRADLDSDHGLRYGPGRPGEACLYLSLSALEAQRQAVVEAFHAGRVVPSRGRAAEIRLEAHVAVLAQLRRTLLGDDVRAPREPAQTATVEAWVGLKDVTGVLQLESHSHGLADASFEAATGSDTFEQVYERPQRRLEVLDASESGWLLEARGAFAAGLVIGELVGLRFHAGTPVVLACVVRCVRPADGDAIEVGVERLSHPRLAVRPCALRSDTRDEGTYLFVPGEDESGRQDAFVVPYRLLESSERFRVARGGRDFALAFNRVRRRGRGWALAGYEMVDASSWEIVVA